MRYLVSLDTKNNQHKLLIHSKKILHIINTNLSYIAKNITYRYISYTMKKVNVNKIFVSCICEYANISIKFTC